MPALFINGTVKIKLFCYLNYYATATVLFNTLHSIKYNLLN